MEKNKQSLVITKVWLVTQDIICFIYFIFGIMTAAFENYDLCLL